MALLTYEIEVGELNSKICEGVPIDLSRVWALAITGIVAVPLAILAIALRTYSRYSIAKKMGSDDWVILVAGAILLVVLALDLIGLSSLSIDRPLC